MIREEVAGLFRLAAAETRERIGEDRERCPERFAPLFRVIEERLFEPGFGVRAARGRSGVGHDTPPLGQPLAAYLDGYRIRTARRMLELADGRVPSGRIAAAIGFASFLTWCRTFRRCVGEAPPLIASPDRVDVVFDDLSWHRACRGELSLDEAVALLERLRRRYPRVSEGAPPAAKRLRMEEWPRRPARRCGGISVAEARKALARAAVKPLSRLESDAVGLPPEEVEILECVGEKLFDLELGVDFCREQTGVRDTSISTRIRFYLGDTLTGVIEKRRVETALGLIVDRRFTIARIAEVVGLSYGSFNRIFRLRAGVHPSEIRETLLRTGEHPAYASWRHAESGTLTHAEARTLIAYLRGLQPDAVACYEPAALAVRTDVRPRRVETILELYEGRGSAAALGKVLRTHPDYSAAHWYAHWVRDRLGREDLGLAWAEWRKANRDLATLLRLPRDRRSEAVRGDRDFQTAAFVWLLVDCVDVRLFQDPAESEHFADLAVAAAEARLEEGGSESAGLRGLTLALQANAMQRRDQLAEASDIFDGVLSDLRSHEIAPWVEGRIYSLHGSLLGFQGKHQQAQETLFRAGSLMKKAGDELERLRTIVDRALNWFVGGSDPSQLLTLCIEGLQKYPFARNLLHSAHVSRLLSHLYLTDQLTGRRLPEIQSLRAALPPADSPFLAANHQQVDGLIAVLAGDAQTGSRLLQIAACWYEEQELLCDAAVCWLEYAWAILEIDAEAARKSALVSYEYMSRTGFAGHDQQRIARLICLEAEGHSLQLDTLRNGILSWAVPKKSARLAVFASRASASPPSASS